MSAQRLRLTSRPTPTQAIAPSVEAERAAYRNLALVRLRALRGEVEQALKGVRGKQVRDYGGGGYGYERYKTEDPTPEQYVSAALEKLDAAINQYESEASDE